MRPRLSSPPGDNDGDRPTRTGCGSDNLAQRRTLDGTSRFGSRPAMARFPARDRRTGNVMLLP
jgi:hypothetical protein